MAVIYKISSIQITLLCVSFIMVSSLPLIQDNRILDNYKMTKRIKQGLSKLVHSNDENVSLKRSRRFAISNTATNNKTGCLKSKTSQCVGVFPNGTVSNAFLYNTIFSRLQLESYQTSVVRIQSLATGLYIGMTRKGRIRGMAKNDSGTLWKETHERNYFRTYQALDRIRKRKFVNKYFLAVKANGKTRNGRTALPGMTAAQFLFLPYNNTKQ